MLPSSGLFHQAMVFTRSHLTAFSTVSQRSCRIGDSPAGHELAYVLQLIDCSAFDDAKLAAGQKICGHVLVRQKSRSQAGASQQRAANPRMLSQCLCVFFLIFVPPLNEQAIAAAEAEIEVQFTYTPARCCLYLICIGSPCCSGCRQASRCRCRTLHFHVAMI